MVKRWMLTIALMAWASARASDDDGEAKPPSKKEKAYEEYKAAHPEDAAGMETFCEITARSLALPPPRTHAQQIAVLQAELNRRLALSRQLDREFEENRRNRNQNQWRVLPGPDDKWDWSAYWK